MEPEEVQRKYLEIQRQIGELVKDAPRISANKLKQLSINLFEIKREWIGIFDEIDFENLEIPKHE